MSVSDIGLRISEVACSAGIALSLVRQYAGGEQGAWEVVDDSGRRYVLKTHPIPEAVAQFKRAAAATTQLRENGYPAPEYIATGMTSSLSYALIEKLCGHPNQPVARERLDELITLNDLQRGQATQSNPGWVMEMANSVLRGCAGYCQVDTLTNHSSTTADILRRIQFVAEHSQDLEAACGDIVHFDYHPANVLSEADDVTGVIDWEGTCVGDASFDLATLLFYCYDQTDIRHALSSIVVRRAGAEALALYLAHMILRQVDWSIRHHDPATSEYFVVRSERILADLT